MNENMKAILEAISEDEELKGEATALMSELAAADEDRPEVVARVLAFAHDRGFELSEEDLVIEAPAEGKVEDEELAAVAGGCGSCGSSSSAITSLTSSVM